MEKYQHNGRCYEAMRFTGSERSANQLCGWVNYDVAEEDHEGIFVYDEANEFDTVLLICGDKGIRLKADDYVTQDSKGNLGIVPRKEFKKTYRRVTAGMIWSK